MLIQFSFNNYGSFKESTVFSMVSGMNNDKNNTFPFENYNILPSSVLYGANASGKTNVLNSFAMMSRIVLNLDKTMLSTDELPHNPFRLSTETENASTAFDIIFSYKNKKYKYGFDYDKGKIYSEYLFYYDTNRPTSVFEYDYDEKKEKVNTSKFPELSGIVHNENLLMLWAADQKKNEIAKNVLQWFKECFFINLKSYNNLSSLSEDVLTNNKNLSEKFSQLIKIADVGIDKVFSNRDKTNLDYLSTDFISNNSLKTIHKKFNEKLEYESDVIFDMLYDESTGTQKYFSLQIPIMLALNDGQLLILDELDASLHPILTRKIVEIFNNPKLNVNGAQLIFTCQDTNLLDSDLFHKSQIWFTEKDKYGESHLTSLADIKDVRADDNFERNYIRGKYGAIPYLGDFDKVFLEQK